MKDRFKHPFLAAPSPRLGAVALGLLAAILCFIELLLFASYASYASDTATKLPSRQKVIDFEDEMVEGMNKRPFDSLSQISEAGRKHRRPHLYRKRASFKSETAETLREIRFIP